MSDPDATSSTESAVGGPRHVVLIGLMGSGKTTTGRLLAERLGRPLVDSDLLIESIFCRVYSSWMPRRSSQR